MNNRPTPDTDERAVPHIGFYSCATVPANFARQLERERDEAREELHDIRLNLGEDAEGYTLTHAVCVLQQERDEAREEWHEEIKFHHRTHSELVNVNCMMLDNQNDARQLADRLTALELQSTSELARLEQERDEAREQAHSFRSFYYAKTGINKGGCAFPWEGK